MVNTDEHHQLDETILEIFEDEQERFYFPVTTQKDARAFVKELHVKGITYDALSAEVNELQNNFTSWRKGLSRSGIGLRVIERINKPILEILLSETEEEEVENDEDDIEAEEENNNNVFPLCSSTADNSFMSDTAAHDEPMDQGSNAEQLAMLIDDSILCDESLLSRTENLNTSAEIELSEQNVVEISKDFADGQKCASSLKQDDDLVSRDGISTDEVSPQESPEMRRVDSPEPEVLEAASVTGVLESSADKALQSGGSEPTSERRKLKLYEEELSPVQSTCVIFADGSTIDVEPIVAVECGDIKPTDDAENHSQTQVNESGVKDLSPSVITDDSNHGDALEAGDVKLSGQLLCAEPDAAVIRERDVDSNGHIPSPAGDGKRSSVDNNESCDLITATSDIKTTNSDVITDCSHSTTGSNDVTKVNDDVRIISGDVTAVTNDVVMPSNEECDQNTKENVLCNKTDRQLGDDTVFPSDDKFKDGDELLQSESQSKNPNATLDNHHPVDNKLHGYEVSNDATADLVVDLTPNLTHNLAPNLTPSPVVDAVSSTEEQSHVCQDVSKVTDETDRPCDNSNGDKMKCNDLASVNNVNNSESAMLVSNGTLNNTHSPNRCSDDDDKSRKSFSTKSTSYDEISEAATDAMSTGEQPISEGYSSDLDLENYGASSPLREQLRQVRVVHHRLAQQTDDGVGYVYAFTDSSNDSKLHRIKLGASRQPYKRLQQATLFNVDIKLVSAVHVGLRQAALLDILNKLDTYRIADTKDWFLGPLDEVLQIMMETGLDYPIN